MRTQANLVIIGAGIVGCSAAYHLTKLGRRDIVVVDQGPLFKTGGSTSHAPGLIFQTNGSRMMCEMAKYTTQLLSTLTYEAEPCWYPVGGIEVAQTDARLTREFIDRIFNRYLTPRERKILYLYYGLESGSEALTLERIGALLGVTRERIRQIRERAFQKLRESPDLAGLKGFWGAA